MSNYFIELAKVNVSEHVEKKGQFSYLSWTFAVNELRKRHPDATWEVKRFDGKPFMQTELGYFVEVEVTVNGISLSQIHPVLDNRNRPIEKPNPFHINTSIQRCLVKAIGLHGLGLYIYAGEDLPTETDPISSEQVGVIKSKAGEYAKLRNGTINQVYNGLKIRTLDELSKDQADACIKQLDAWLKVAKEKNNNANTENKPESQAQSTNTKTT